MKECIFIFLKRVVPMSVLVWLSGCAMLSKAPETECERYGDSLTRVISTFTHMDPATATSPDSIFLRGGRFLASYDPALMSETQRHSWLHALKDEAVKTYQIELSRVPEDEKRRLLINTHFKSHEEALTSCGNKAVASIDNPSRIIIDDSYSSTARFFGIYPLLSRLAQGSIDEYREMMTEKYIEGEKSKFDSKNVYGYVGEIDRLSFSDIEKQLSDARSIHPLKIPQLDEAALENLFILFAPQLEVETDSEYDAIGSISYRESADVLGVNINSPVLYTYPTYTRWQNRVLLQLNYGFWFPGRPAKESFDIYAGELDGIIWRVTLGVDGRPLVYDSIHQCGCYHKFYLPEGTNYDFSHLVAEKPLAFELKEQLDRPSGMRLKIEATTHYIVNVAPESPRETKQAYELSHYDALLALPLDQRYQSMFGSTGIVDQSARIERWFLWPLGVPNAGAMRQRGMHAVAFIGKRHFDDPMLLDDLNIR